MKYPKLWNGPHAIGEALTRAMNRVRSPFLSASGVGYSANKIGRRSEVFHEGGEPSFYVLYSDAMSRTKFPVRLGKTVSTADVPASPGYPIWYPWEAQQPSYWRWMRDRFVVVAGTNRLASPDQYNMLFAREDIEGELTAIPERMVAFYKYTFDFANPTGAGVWTPLYSTLPSLTVVGGVPTATILEYGRAETGVPGDPEWFVARTFRLNNFGNTVLEEWELLSDVALHSNLDRTPVLWRVGANTLVQVGKPEPVAIAALNPQFPLPPGSARVGTDTSGPPTAKFSTDGGVTWTAWDWSALPSSLWGRYQEDPLFPESIVQRREVDVDIVGRWMREDGIALVLVRTLVVNQATNAEERTYELYNSAVGSPMVKLMDFTAPGYDIISATGSEDFTFRGRPVITVRAYPAGTTVNAQTFYFFPDPTDPTAVWQSIELNDPTGSVETIVADRGKWANLAFDGDDTFIHLSSSRGVSWRRVYRIDRTGQSPRTIIAVRDSKGRPAHIYPDQPWRGDDSLTPPWEVVP